MSQSAPDIRKKLQKLEGFEGKSLSEQVEVPQKAFNNREDSTADLNKRIAKVLLAMTEGKGTKKEGHHGGQAHLRNRMSRASVPCARKEGTGKRNARREGQAAPILVKEVG